MADDLRREVQPEAYGLVVGISQYRDPKIPKLDFTLADARGFAELLTDPERAGFPKDNVTLLLDTQATLFNIKHAISGWLFQKANVDSTVVVFFAGHGGLESDKTGTEKDGVAKYLLPWDTDLENLFASALSNAEFQRLLSTIQAKRLVIFMDSCYAGGVSQRGARDLGVVENPFQALAEGQGRLVIASAQPNQRSWEDAELGHGIFTHHLIEALGGKADLDNDGYVSIWEVFKYLERAVPESARRLAKSLQEPLLCGDIAKDIRLTASRRRILEQEVCRAEDERRAREESQARRRKLFELHESDVLSLEMYEEALHLIGKPPEGLSAAERRLIGLLKALLKDAISVELYIESREAIMSIPVAPAPQPAGRSGPAPPPAGHVTEPTRAHTAPESEYCIECGARLYPDHLFCVGCGRRIRP